MNLILEINGRDIERVQLSSNGISVGRALSNQVILKDQFVDAQHCLLLLRDGELVVQDLNSTNGTEVLDKQIKGEESLYRLGEKIAVGDTVLRLLDVNGFVEKTRKKSYWFDLVRRFKVWPLLLTLLGFICGVEIFDSWVFSTEGFSFFDALSSLFTALTAVFVVAGCFAILTKLIKGRSSFREHLILVSFISVFEKLSEYVVWIIRFNMQNYSIGNAVGIVLEWCVFALILIAGLSYASQLPKVKVWFLSALIASAFIYKDYADELTKEDHERWSKYSNAENIAFPPAFLFRKTTDMDTYFKEADQLFDKVQEQGE